jgi:hypothetical protein
MTPKRHISETLCIHCNICNGYIFCQIVCENICFHEALFKWRYGDSNPGPLACHLSLTLPLSSAVVQACHKYGILFR